MKTLFVAMAFLLTIAGLSAKAQESGAAQGVDPMGSLLEVMKDEVLRNQLIREIEDARSKSGDGSTSSSTSPATTAGAEGAVADMPSDEMFGTGGLATGLMAWLRELAARLPSAALGAPIDEKLRLAEIQIERRLSAPEAFAGIRDLWLRWLPGWMLGTAAAIAVLVAVRRRMRAGVARSATMGQVAREAALRSGLGLLPLAACLVTIMAWMVALDLSTRAGVIFIALAMPFVVALAASGLTSALLLLLAPSKGWRLVAYAQRRLSPSVGLLTGVAAGAAVMTIPEIRAAIGPAAADIAVLLLDVSVPLVALLIIFRDRRIVRTLIVRGHVPDESSSPLDRAIYRVGTQWHRLGVIFVVLNIGARVFGTQTGSFLTQSFLSLAVIVVALILSSILRRASEDKDVRVARVRRRSVRRAVFERSKSIVVGLAQMGIAAVAVIACLSLWGVDVVTWAGTSAGASIVGPLLAIAILVLAAWTLWIVLDSWIAEILAPANAVDGRQRSARVMTLLPLLRNFAFVALSILTVMGVLSNLGINIAPLIAGAGVVGLAIGFGSQQLVQDVITGLFILLEDTIAIGDVISTGDRTGTVEALTIRTVKIRDGEGALHSIPFSTIKALKNSSRGYGVYTASVTLDIDADVARAIEVMDAAGNELHSDPAFRSKIVGPFDVSGIDQIGLDGIVIKGSVKTRPLQQGGVGNEINRRIRDALQRAGIPLARRSAPVAAMTGTAA